MEVLDNKCPSCNANIKFNPKSGTWKCEFCGSEFNVEDFEKYKKEIDKEEIDEVNVGEEADEFEMDEYHCENCGATIIADKNTTATFCVYCRNTTIIKNRLQGEFKPSEIIPFKQEKESVMKKFREFIKSKWFAPKEFLDEKNIQDVTGIYIPFWIYDCNTEGEFVGKGENVTHWSDFSYSYTKTDVYSVRRKGTMAFDNVPTDASTKFDDNIMDSIEPYNYEDMLPFSSAYLSGFLAEKYDVSKEDAFVRAEERVKHSVIDELKNSGTHYTTLREMSSNVDITDKTSEYVLLPVWLLNFKYKNKLYPFAMNGQTGKMIGNIPIAISKAAITWLLTTFGCIVLGILFTMIASTFGG